MFDRTFGAVARDVHDEMCDLETIRIRNRRFSKNPLSEYFLADLFAPVKASEIFAFRADWRMAATELANFMERARSQHWEAIVGRVEHELSVAHWLRAWRRPDVQADPVAQQIFRPEVDKATSARTSPSNSTMYRGIGE
ncbi:hypothetical protein bAD24_I05265 [Burkholderia sp. AD24]|nr:hypothetical protein bAD24_I05265 [Burkholderia sp. AD24]